MQPALPAVVENVRKLGTVLHAPTHRRYRFTVYVCDAAGNAGSSRRRSCGNGLDWTSWTVYPLPRPHLKIAEMLRAMQR